MLNDIDVQSKNGILWLALTGASVDFEECRSEENARAYWDLYKKAGYPNHKYESCCAPWCGDRAGWDYDAPYMFCDYHDKLISRCWDRQWGSVEWEGR